MKEFLYKITSSTVAFLVLFSTLSFTVDKHYCGDRLVEVAIFSDVKGCGMVKDMEIDKETSDVISFSKTSCCKNESSFIEGNSIDQQAVQKLKLQQINFATALIVSFNNLTIETSHITSFSHYDPPIVDHEVIILYENFRI